MRNRVFPSSPVMEYVGGLKYRMKPARGRPANTACCELTTVLPFLLGALAWVVFAAQGPAASLDEITQTPPLRYVQKATWFDSMLASRAALQADEVAGARPAPKVSFHSDVVRGRQPAQSDFRADRTASRRSIST